MAALHVYRSNHLEALADALATVTRQRLGSVLEPEIIVVQSLGIRRWLSLELARRLGVTMNCEFPFPATFLEQIFSAVLPDSTPSRAFERHVLPWRILQRLASSLGEPAFDNLRVYLAGENRALKEYQLATRIAAVFDRYLAYRHRLILEWQGGAGTHWQAQLWRELAAGHERAHTPALARELAAALSRDRIGRSGLPTRVSLFGISSLPPFYVELFGAFSSLLEVHLFLLTPTPEYWSDLRSPKEQQRSAHRQPRPLENGALHFATGNLLLASLGRIGREFAEGVLALDPLSEKDLCVPPAATTLLGHVQADLFYVRERGADEKVVIDPADRSIQLHCCHGPMREVEVLHDQLLDLFQHDPALTPRDILVTMPDVEVYAPFIEAVFGAPEDWRRAIPFTIADRAARAGSTIADAFLRLLELADSRFGATAVLDLLETAAIQRRFELAESDVQTIRTWVHRAGIRWGIDAAHRAELGLPSFDEATWRTGLRRLLLGYALPGDDQTLFEGILPDREIEGALAVTLGSFLDFLEELFSRVRALRNARPLAHWEPALRATLDAFFFDHDDFAPELHRVRDVFGSLGQIARDAAFDAPVEFEVIRAHLAQAFAEQDSGPDFLAGRVTFCALKPMRSIPFQVIGLLGMNDGAFPRHETLLAFDLAAQHPQPGDRTLREDDRYLFLETLLSARRILYLSYSGLSQRERAVSPPSVIVSELLDYLDNNFTLAALPIREHLVTQHRLQPFSPAYFAGDRRLFSYSTENWRASQSSRAARHPPPIFGEQPLPEPDLPWRQVDLDRLASFFVNPARFFVRERLGIRLPDDEPPLDDREPIQLEPLARYELRMEAARQALANVPAHVTLPLTRAAGKLPPAFAGATLHHELRGEADQLAAAVQPHLAVDLLPPLTIDLPLGNWHLRGTLHQLRANTLLEFRAADLRAKDMLRAWIRHLALNAVHAPGYPRTTLVFAQDKRLTFGPVDDAREQLAALLEIYGRGLCQPLRFFPETSWKFAERARDPAARGNPVDAARGIWHSEIDSERPESRNAHFQFCFRHVSDPLDAEWEELARAVFDPLAAAIETSNR